MAEEVEIVNVEGGRGPAAEATLLTLLSEVKKRNLADGIEEKIRKKATDAQKANIEAIEESTESLELFSEEVDDARTVLDVFAGGILSVAGAATGIIGNFSKELVMGGDRMSDFSQHIPIVGSIITSVVQYFEQTVDVFRNLSEIGGAFGNDLSRMKLAAAESGMSLDMFAGFVAKNSERMLFLGGTVTDGAEQFGRLTRDIRNSAEGFMQMGYTMESLNDFTAEYIALQARQNRLQGMTEGQLRSGTAEYLKQLDQLSKITGKSRKQLANQLSQQQAEANIAAISADLRGEGLKNFQNNITWAESELGVYANAVKDLSDGLPQTPLGKILATLVPGFMELQVQNAKGQVVGAEYIRRTQEMMPRLRAFRDGLKGAAVSALQMEDGYNELFSGMHQALEVENKNYDPAKAAAEQAKRYEVTKGLTEFEQKINAARAKIEEVFITSKIFELVGDGITTLAEWMTSKETLGALTQGITDLGKWIKEFIGDANANGIWETIKTRFEQADWSGLYKLIADKFGELVQYLKTEVDWGSIVDSITGGIHDLLFGRDEASERVVRAGDPGIDGPAEMQTSQARKGLLEGILPDLNGYEFAALGVAGVLATGGALFLAVSGLQLLLKGFANPKVAIGMAVLSGGVFAAAASFKLVAEGIDLIAGSVGKTADGLLKFETVDTDKLTKVATALGPFTTPLMDLAKGGVVANFVGSNALPNLAKGIESFESVNADAITKIGPALTTLHDGISSFTGDGIMDAISSVFATLVGGAGIGGLAEDILKFQKIEPETITKLGPAFTSLKQGLNQLTGAGFLDSIGNVFSTFVGSSGIGGLADGLKSFNGINTDTLILVGDKLKTFTELDFKTDKLDGYVVSIKKLTEALDKLNDELKQDNTSTFGGKRADAGKLLNSIAGSSSSSNETIQTLNTTLSAVVTLLQQNTRQNSDMIQALERIRGVVY